MEQLEMLEKAEEYFCLACKKTKHIKEFSLGCVRKNKNGTCKDCKNKKGRASYSKNKEKYKQRLTKYRTHNRAKTAAMKKVQNALRTGKLTTQPCEECGAEKTDAHHDDYAKPLDVRWLCRKHHMKWHRHHGEALNAFTVKHWTPPTKELKL